MAGVPGRAKTNWVGVVLEAPDPQALADYVPPTWPAEPGKQLMMMHVGCLR